MTNGGEMEKQHWWSHTASHWSNNFRSWRSVLGDVGAAVWTYTSLILQVVLDCIACFRAWTASYFAGGQGGRWVYKGPGFSSCSQCGLEGFQALPPVTIRVIIQAVGASVCSWRLLRAAVSLGQLWNSSDHVERLRSLRSVLFVCTWMWVLLSAHGAWRPASNSRRVSCYCGEAAALWWILLPGAALHAAAAFILQLFD